MVAVGRISPGGDAASEIPGFAEVRRCIAVQLCGGNRIVGGEKAHPKDRTVPYLIPGTGQGGKGGQRGSLYGLLALPRSR